MALARQKVPMGWDERWRMDKERRKKVIEEGGEKEEEENRRLRWIKAYNDNRMGVKHSVWQECTRRYNIPVENGGPVGREEGRDCQEGKRTYHSVSYTTQLFQTLEAFRQASLLTDLTLITQDGQSLCAHSPVLAAVSSIVYGKLQEQQKIQDVPVKLGSEVSRLGLAAVLDFAYTGAITNVTQETVAQVQAAAQALGAPRVLELCNTPEGKDKCCHGNQDTEEKRTKKLSASEQLEVSLQAIKRLWIEGVGCDIVLDAQEREFRAHRVFLAASSDYFRGMFTSGMTESQQSSIAVPYLNDGELEVFLHCSYSGALELSWDQVFDLICSALQFQIQPALSLCLDFLKREMDADSCLDVASFAEAYGMRDLCELADDYVLVHFLEVSATPKFQDLSAEKVLEYLCCDGLCAPSELMVFRAVVTWLEADISERLPQASRLMKGVRFPLMTFREFCEVRAINLCMECSADGNDVELYRAAFKEFGNSASEERFRVRRPKDALVLIGGDQLDPDVGLRLPSRQLWFANAMRSGVGLVKDIEWRMLGEIPDQARFRHGAAVLADKLYVVGGCHFYSKTDTMKSGFSYDPQNNTWQRIADMHEQRSNFTLVVQGNSLHAIGGDKDINTNLDSVEVFCPESNSWRFTRPLDQALSGHAAGVWKGEIFISGGFTYDYKCLASTFRYHPERGTTHMSDMAHDRALHCMETLGGRFFVAGGVCNLNKFYTDHLGCEVYDPAADSWCGIAPLPIPHVGAASAILEERLYVLGGYCQEDYREASLVHRYDPTTGRWQRVGKMPGPNTDIRACVFRLPEELRK